MKKMICTVRVALLGFSRGHKWRRVYVPSVGGRGAPAEVCTRCGESGWSV